MSRILVTGSTGNVGSRLVRQLVERGQSVRAFVRAGSTPSFPAGVEVAEGDFTDMDSLRRALAGVSKMYLLSAGYQLSQHEANAIAAAREANLEFVLKHSVAGAQWKSMTLTRWHAAGEEALAASGLPYAYLRPASFATNALGWAGSIKAQGVVYGALGDAALPVVDPGDIAAAAAVVLTTPGHAGKAYDLTGPEAITSAQQVEAIAAALGRPLQYVNVPDSAAHDALIGMGMAAPDVDAMVEMIGALRAMGRIEPTGDVQALTGNQPRSFAQWAVENVAAFR